jgi:PST family polysaccharide transporter
LTSTDEPASEFDPREGSLRRSVGRGAAATALAQAIQVATQIASVLTLSRLLAPEDFGLVAMCTPVIAFLGMLQDFGLVQATVQKKGLLREEVNFLFWINVAMSGTLALLLLALSPAIALFYQEPRVGPLIAAMALPMVLGGLGAQHLALLNRRMEFGRIAMVSGAGAVTTLLVAVVWALVSPSYWALFAGTLSGSLLSTTLAWTFSRWRPSRPRRVAGGRSLLGFGAGITGFNFSNFFARNLDNILIGRVWGEAQLGFYDRAYKLLLFPLSQISNPLSRVMVPALSRMVEEPGRYRHAYFRVLNLSLLVSMPGVAFATGMADVLIPFLLGEQWRPSAAIFMALGLAGLMQPLNNPAGWLFISQGRSNDYMVWGFASAAFAITAIVAGLSWGALGVAIAYAISEYLKTPPLWLVVCRKGPVRVSDVVRACGPSVLAAHGALLAVYLGHDALAQRGAGGLVTSALLSYITFAVIVVAFASGRATLREIAELARRIPMWPWPSPSEGSERRAP